MNNDATKAELKGKYLETVLHQNGDFVSLEFFPNDKRKAFVENMKRIAKEFHLEVIWKEHKDAMFLL